MPGAGSSPKSIETSSGKQPKNPERSPIQSISAVTSSSTSTGAARIASYVRWKRSFTNVPNMAGNALEKITAVATMPCAHILDVVEPVDAVHDRRAKAEAERQQVDHGLEHAREGRGLPEGAEVRRPRGS